MSYTSDERRRLIAEYLSCCKASTIAQLADEFLVSYNTVQRDITYLTRFYPISTSFGRYGGGVKFDGEKNLQVHLTPRQANAINQMLTRVSPQDAKVLVEILETFSLKK